jgi:tetratricopeptide (TPR) repeat protein
MPLSACPRRFLIPLILTGILPVAQCGAQQTPPPAQTQTAPSPGAGDSSSSRVPGLNPDQNSGPAQQLAAPAEQANAPKAPSLMDPAGPTVSLETSEAMFEMAVALNACGYDAGLDESAPVRKQVRTEVNQALLGSARARDDRDKLCVFIDQHRLDDPGRTLAQYVSLALYLTPPPEMTPSVESEDLPPDASGVEEILPTLRKFADDLELHVIWLENRPAYESLVNQLHEPLTKMIVGTNYYLKMPAQTSNARRFLVVLEPMLSPEETNARVYGPDYVVVASPKDDQIQMHLVRHAYLHYEIEPLLYAREDSLDRLLPLLKVVDDAPLQFTFKSDIVALVIESMIRAIEARTMDTGVPEVKIPAGLSHSEAEPYERARSEAQVKIAAIKQQNVDHSMAQGYVLTQYFYDQLIAFERNPESLEEAIGPMVYGMDMGTEVHRAKQITFDAHGEDDPMSHAPVQPKGLEVAELKLMKGDVAGAGEMAQKALATHTGDAGQADFILARVDLMNGKIEDAASAFRDAIGASKDPRTLAWSHIYLGRILDVEEQRDDAVAEYKAALTVRDGQPDTKAAAENGIKQPFVLPHHADASGSDQGSPKAQAPGAATPQPNSQPSPQ